MKKLLIVTLAALGTTLSATIHANQTSEDQIALMELERDYMALINEPKHKMKTTSNVDDDEPDCD